MAKLMQAHAIALYCVLILAMQIPTLMANAHGHRSHHQLGGSQQQLWTTAKSGNGGCCAGQTLQNITVYNYLSIQGPNSTTGYNTAQCGAPLTTQPNGFGRTFCFDMPLLLQQDLSSKLLGAVQGSYVFVSLDAPGSTLFVTETFTLNTSTTPQGSFSASGLEKIGQVSSKPITGGTDAFAFLVGVATTSPLSNSVDGNGNLVSWFKYDFTFRSTTCH